MNNITRQEIIDLAEALYTASVCSLRKEGEMCGQCDNAIRRYELYRNELLGKIDEEERTA